MREVGEPIPKAPTAVDSVEVASESPRGPGPRDELNMSAQCKQLGGPDLSLTRKAVSQS